MRNKKLFWITAIFLAWFGRDGARGQQKQPVSSLQEDCGVTFLFTVASSGAQAPGTVIAGSAGTTSIIDNRQVGCLDWVVTYEPSSAVATLSLAFQTALDVAGTPTTWSNYPGTLSSGINPNTAITTGGAVTEATGTAYPFLRMNLTVLMGGGTVSGKLLGWKRRPGSSGGGSGCVGTIATPCVVAGPTADGAAPTTSPVLVAGQDGTNTQTILTDTAGRARVVGAAADGAAVVGDPVRIAGKDGGGLTQDVLTDTSGRPNVVGAAATGAAIAGNPVNFGTSDGINIVQPFICTANAFVNLSGSGDTQIVALTAAVSIHVCEVYFSTTAPVDIKLTTGTGSNCGTGTADFSPLFKSVQSGRLSFNPGAVTVPSANALCMNQSVAQANGVWVSYVKF